MTSLKEIRSKTRTLSCRVFDSLEIKFDQRLCVMDREGENALDQISEISETVTSIENDPNLSIDERRTKLRQLKRATRDLCEKQVLLYVRSWDLKEDPSDSSPIELTPSGLDQADVPLEVYQEIISAIRNTPMIPKASS